MSSGTNLAQNVVKKALSMGADELFLLKDKVFAEGGSSPTACPSAMAISEMNEYDFFLCERQAADRNAQASSCIAEILGIPSVTPVRRIEIVNGRVPLPG